MSKETAKASAPVHQLVGQPCFDVWGRVFPGTMIRAVNDLSGEDWTAMCDAARFRPVSGRRADELVSNELGHLYIIDTTGEAHAVDPLKFVGVIHGATHGAIPASDPNDEDEAYWSGDRIYNCTSCNTPLHLPGLCRDCLPNSANQPPNAAPTMVEPR